jgi:hypothetical protein
MDFVVFKQGLTKKVGLVIDIYEEDMLIWYNKASGKLELTPVDKVKVINVYRNATYMGMFDIYLKQRTIFGVYTGQKTTLKKAIAGANNGSESSLYMIYLLTSADISYKIDPNNAKITIKELFTNENKFRTVL